MDQHFSIAQERIKLALSNMRVTCGREEFAEENVLTIPWVWCLTASKKPLVPIDFIHRLGPDKILLKLAVKGQIRLNFPISISS